MTIERASDNPFPSILMVEGDPEALAANPAAGQRRLAVGADHLLYLVDDAGVKTLVGGAGASDLDALLALSSGQDISDALSGAAAPDAANVFATMADVGVGGGGDYIRLGESVNSGTSQPIDVTGISGSYRDLIIVFKARSSSGLTDPLQFRVGNGSIDTGSNYAWYISWASSLGASADAAITTSTIRLAPAAPTTSTTTGVYMTGSIEIIDYASTSDEKTLQWRASFYDGPNNVAYNVTGGGTWYTTGSAIDQVRLYLNSGSGLIIRSRMTVYGRA